jgi:alkyl hydroperoxide reductase subunit F
MIYDVIIIGGGPAGVAAGIYAARKKLKALFLTKGFGGQSVNSADIQNFIGFKSISGADFAKVLEEHLRAQEGIEIKDGVWVVSVKKRGDLFEVADDEGGIYQTRTVLYAAGSGYKKLNIPGEKEYEGKGVFYCSICDAPLMKNKVVAVIGGGNSGLESVIDLLPYASQIHLLEYAPELRGDPVFQERIKKEPKVAIITNIKTEEIFGDNFVKGLRYEDMKTGEKKTLELSGVFISIGWTPNSDLLKELVKIDGQKHIVVNHQTLQTSYPGIWAAGDVTDSLYAQINPAIGEGVKALLNIYDFLNRQEPVK